MFVQQPSLASHVPGATGGPSTRGFSRLIDSRVTIDSNGCDCPPAWTVPTSRWSTVSGTASMLGTATSSHTIDVAELAIGGSPSSPPPRSTPMGFICTANSGPVSDKTTCFDTASRTLTVLISTSERKVLVSTSSYAMWTLPSEAFTGTGLVSTDPATSVNCVSGLIPGGPVRAGPASAGSMPATVNVPVSTTTPPSSDRRMRTSRCYSVVINFGPRICPSSQSPASTGPSYSPIDSTLSVSNIIQLFPARSAG